MSLYIDGVLASSVGFSPVPRSSISRAFLSRIPARYSSQFGVTTVAGPFASLSTILHCELSATDSTDFVLGLDWVSMHSSPLPLARQLGLIILRLCTQHQERSTPYLPCSILLRPSVIRCLVFGGDYSRYL
ncbi:hypothetical protein C8F04DRAFT_1279533 [Mycena alexandri]|uniref:Uncharacterized protein n=1 Tax=Mycena alexandri TaxID=1745969 RepID=A0AAD6WQQ3_9AGAR|nr:hypothetical protein C8F04DRAFT_1279533 [Mycena alexandri]